MNYSKMSTEELLKLRTQINYLVFHQDNEQLAMKILLNSVYGALA